jgi:hypothetical protein
MIPLTLALSLRGRGEGWERVKCQYYFEIDNNRKGGMKKSSDIKEKHYSD